MPEPVQLPLAARPHHNQQLFADHYLDAILPEQSGWRALAAEAAPLLARIAAILGAYTPTANEAQTEQELIRPILTVLGHTYDVQAPLRTPDGSKRPDYVFYRDEAARLAHKGQVLTDALPQAGGLAVGDAKGWDRPLDQASKGGGDPFTNKNPAYQIAFYVQHSGLPWGLLTNGRRWRLVHQASAHKLDQFYEVDLPDLVAGAGAPGGLSRFLYFYAFFRRGAFEPGPLGLAAILQGSAEYARGVGDTLKSQVYDALRHLAQGFLDYTPNGLKPDKATLDAIYDAALIVLYRLLFVLYAEARELLPVTGNAAYRQSYSLRAITAAVAQDLTYGRVLRPGSALLWPRLRELFRLIDAGDPALGVATYDGGLFDPDRHPFLERYTVGDAHLQQALDKLARVDGQAVDYRDLAVRHLGTIYEGLLEYHLEARAEGDWAVALLNDKGERHASGSYYTPDFIVAYMVEQTLGPAVEAAVAGAGDEAAQAGALLALNVLDPAMGSGHFLVEATEYLARRAVALGLPLPDGAGSGSLAEWKRRVAQSCIYGVDLNPLAVELAKLSLWLITVAQDRPLSFLDHHLRAGNALVGARVADLEADAPPAPRARRARQEARQAAAGQLSMLDDPAFQQALRAAVDSMWLIERSPGATVAQVKEQEQVYRELRARLLGQYGAWANLITARRLGALGEVDAASWRGLVDYAAGRALAPLPRYQSWLAAAARLAGERRFLHWELEFPEVFFDRYGRPRGAAGFDVVIGNPPYVRQEALGPLKPYFATTYPLTYDGVADLYIYFFQRGLELTRGGGRMSYIVTNKWMRAGYGAPLRGYFAAQGALEQIVDFGHAPIFPDADVFPCIVVLAKPDPAAVPPDPAEVQVTTFPRELLRQIDLERYVAQHHLRVPRARFTAAPWSLEPAPVDDLLAKIRRAGVSLAEFAGVKPYYGIKTGLNEAFLIDTPTRERLLRDDPQAAGIIKPCLRGQDIKRWVPDWQGLWMIMLPSSTDRRWPWSEQGDEAESVFAQTFPAIHQHLKAFEDRLQVRQDKGRFWWELRACAYYDVFERPKIIHTDITWRPQFALAEDPTYLLNTAYVWPTTDAYLLAVLNSPLMWAYMWRNAMHGKDEALRLIYSFVETLPIAPPSEAIRAGVEPAVARLIALTRARQEANRAVLDWLRTEFEVATPGQRLEDFAALEEAAFVDEVRKRRPRAAGPLTPAGLKALRAGYAEQAGPVRAAGTEAAALEGRLADLVNAAYGLTPDEVALLWATAPPRMPRF